MKYGNFFVESESFEISSLVVKVEYCNGVRSLVFQSENVKFLLQALDGSKWNSARNWTAVHTIWACAFHIQFWPVPFSA